MINENEIVHDHYHDHSPGLQHHHLTRISWTAIVVGALVGVGLGFLLHLYAVAIGLSIFSASNDNAEVVAYGGLIGMLIGVIASMLASGYAAGYLGRLCCPQRNLGILYGFTTWTLALILGAVVASHISQYASSYSTNVSQSVAAGVDNQVNAVVKSTPDSDRTNQNVGKIEAPARTFTWAAFIAFALFFIGAVFTCIGACWGMGCRDRELELDREREVARRPRVKV